MDTEEGIQQELWRQNWGQIFLNMECTGLDDHWQEREESKLHPGHFSTTPNRIEKGRENGTANRQRSRSYYLNPIIQLSLVKGEYGAPGIDLGWRYKNEVISSDFFQSPGIGRDH